jgi:hypothetical protein
VFGAGFGADCRDIVIKLNTARGHIEEEAQLNRALTNHRRELEESKNSKVEEKLEETQGTCRSHTWNSKWFVFVDNDVSRNQLD